jgi:hypothetical protein
MTRIDPLNIWNLETTAVPDGHAPLAVAVTPNNLIVIIDKINELIGEHNARFFEKTGSIDGY